MKERIGNLYEFDRQTDVIGRGGMGTVYRGINTTTNAVVAIKQLHQDLIQTNPDFLVRFLREADVLRQLTHPNIITIHDVISDVELGHYLVMDYIDGGSVWYQQQATRQLPMGRVLTLAKEMASALMLVHQQGIIHRDIKPANILIADDKSPRLSDFGVVYVQDKTRLTELDGLVGTLDYLSPEALQGQTVTAKNDIWALGVMLYEMVGGKRPFGGDSVGITLNAIMTKPHPDLHILRPDVDVNLARLIDWMLVKNPQDRVADMMTVHQMVSDIINGLDTGSLYIPITRIVSFKRIGTPPKFFADDPFYDRTTEQATLSNYLTDKKPFIGVYGRGGIGKTALVSKVDTVLKVKMVSLNYLNNG
ncbi:MAG: serine/threonine protein kinase, partial [Anaerolineae bacterium]|nr:serine/threonine protein kinase [Anaerolineae bacterium]